MTKGPITGKLLRFFFPVLFGMLFQQLYNTVDAIIVGNCVGPAALAAVGGSPAVIINLVIGFFTGLASGATVIIITHNKAITPMGDRVISVRSGRVQDVKINPDPVPVSEIEW